MIQLLDHYFAFTQQLDWEEGGRPIVFQSLTRTAFDLGVTERQIQKLERQLFEVGAITWNDSGNHRRFGQRDAETGAITFAFGVDLTPLAFLKETLQNKLHEKQLYTQAFLETKRQISWYRRQIRSTILEQQQTEEGVCSPNWQSFSHRYEEIAYAIRNYMPLQNVRDLLAEHKRLYEEMLAQLPAVEGEFDARRSQLDSEEQTQKSSSIDEPPDVHIQTTTNSPFDKSNTNNSPTDDGFQDSVTKPSERQTTIAGNANREKRQEETDGAKKELILATGLQHISLSNVLQAMSDRFREYLPLSPRPMNWPDVTEAAYRLRPQLHISQQSWAEACGLLGRNGAAVCLILTDRATQRPDNRVIKPAGYFRAMVNRAKTGELKLHKSIFGIVEHSKQQESH